jgi:GT2 family glycosyltransferase
VTDRPLVGVVVLTQGRRPAELARAVRSVLAQEGVRTDVVVVGNGWTPAELPDGVRALALPENVGIPAGRNAGVPHVDGDLLLFLDDDAALPDPGFLAEAARRFAADPRLGLLQPRVDAPTAARRRAGGRPRMRVGDRSRSSPVFSVWEGAVVTRRAVFDRARRVGRRRSSTRTRASSWPGACGTPTPRSTTPATSRRPTR